MSTIETAADLEDLRVGSAWTRSRRSASPTAPRSPTRTRACTPSTRRRDPRLAGPGPRPGDGLNRDSFAVLPRVLTASAPRLPPDGRERRRRQAAAAARAGVEREDVVCDALPRRTPSRCCGRSCRRRSPRWRAATPRRCCTPRALAGGGSPDVNSARLLATDCIEMTFPWAPDSPVASRGADVSAPMPSRRSARTPCYPTSLAGCEDWPPTPRPAPLPAAAPQMPVLVISGRDDIRTPLESARADRRRRTRTRRCSRSRRRPLGHAHDYSRLRAQGRCRFLTASRSACAPSDRSSRPRPTCPRTCTAAARSTRTVEAACRDRTSCGASTCSGRAAPARAARRLHLISPRRARASRGR